MLRMPTMRRSPRGSAWSGLDAFAPLARPVLVRTDAGMDRDRKPKARGTRPNTPAVLVQTVGDGIMWQI